MGGKNSRIELGVVQQEEQVLVATSLKKRNKIRKNGMKFLVANSAQIDSGENSGNIKDKKFECHPSKSLKLSRNDHNLKKVSFVDRLHHSSASESLSDSRQNRSSLIADIIQKDCSSLILEFLEYRELSIITLVSRRFMDLAEIALLHCKNLRMSNELPSYPICTRQLFSLVQLHAHDLKCVTLRIGCQTPAVLTTTNLPYLKRLVKRNKNISDMNVDKSFTHLAPLLNGDSLQVLSIRMSQEDCFCEKLPCFSTFSALNSLYLDFFDSNVKAFNFVECLQGCYNLETLCFGKVNQYLQDAFSAQPLHQIKNAFCEFKNEQFFQLFPYLTGTAFSKRNVFSDNFNLKTLSSLKKLFIYLEFPDYKMSEIKKISNFLCSIKENSEIRKIIFLPEKCVYRNSQLSNRNCRPYENCYEHNFIRELKREFSEDSMDLSIQNNFRCCQEAVFQNNAHDIFRAMVNENADCLF